MSETGSYQGTLVLISASVLAVVLGSVHAFSVFLIPLETSFGASRSLVSATYSLALGSLTLAVLFGHRLFSRWSAVSIVLATCLIAALGTLIAAVAPALPVVWLGYSLLFGGANGLGYGFGLQIAAQTNRGREGLSMGIVTAAYALGAAISPKLFALAVTVGGFQVAMLGLAAALLATALVCSVLFGLSRAVFKSEPSAHLHFTLPARDFSFLWLGYGTGVAAGLMTIGHAAGIATYQRFDGGTWVAPAVIAISNLAGSLIIGRLIDLTSPLRLLAGLPLVSMAGIAALAVSSGSSLMILSFAIVGFAYGGIIAAYPAAIAKTYGSMNSSLIYGRVFTAWGCAGLLSPWVAGRLFDWSGSYQIALWTAGALGLTSVFAMLMFIRCKD